VTAFDDVEIRAQSLANGAIAYLAKPLQVKAPIDAVNAAVASGSPHIHCEQLK